jgi:RNA polymerase sigma-70 factor (ECF subfamily)
LYFHELSQEQLAKQLDIPLGTVKSRLRLAMAKLKQQLGDNHD